MDGAMRQGRVSRSFVESQAIYGHTGPDGVLTGSLPAAPHSIQGISFIRQRVT